MALNWLVDLTPKHSEKAALKRGKKPNAQEADAVLAGVAEDALASTEVGALNRSVGHEALAQTPELATRVGRKRDESD